MITKEYEAEEVRGNHYRADGQPDTVTELYNESVDAGHYFCYGNIKKYVKRLGKKGGTPEEIKKTFASDLFKIANYCIFILNHEFGKNYSIEEKKSNEYFDRQTGSCRIGD